MNSCSIYRIAAAAGRRMFFLLACVAAAVSVLSCEKNSVPSGKDDRTGVIFLVGDSKTRAGVTGHESDLRSIDFKAFHLPEGSLVAERRVQEKDSIHVSLPAGKTVRYRVVTNAPAEAFADVTTEADFLAKNILLSFGNGNSIPMYGVGEIAVMNEQSEPVSIVADRYFSKVSLGTVKLNWLSSFATAPDVHIGRVILVNVVGSIPANATPTDTPVQWYNRKDVESLAGIPSDYLLQDYSSVAIPSSGIIALDCDLYCCPNPSDNDVDSWNDGGSWSPRPTRLAVEVVVNGESNWYPVTIKDMRCNRHYKVTELNLNGPGSDSPDKPVKRDLISFKINIEDWVESNTTMNFPADE